MYINMNVYLSQRHPLPPPHPPLHNDDVYLIELQREVLQNLISTRSKENTHENNKSCRYNRTAQRCNK
jgi:hypothetical protein